MKVLINAINARQGGGQTYLLNLLSYMPDEDDLEVTLLVGASFKEDLIADGINVVKVDRWIENPLLRPWWERFFLPKLLRGGDYDVLFCPGGVVNTKPSECKLVTMSRNMLPFDRKQRARYPLFSYQRLRNWMLARIMSRSMLAADLVIFISEYAKDVIEAYVGSPLKSTTVIPHGIADQFRFDTNPALVYPESMPERYLLYVSNVDVYKAQLEVVRAFSLLAPKESGLSLVLVGPERSFYANRVRKEISRMGLDKCVQMLGSVPYATLPAMYQHALVNVFASECENCPNILLEMMASGRPVVCSSYSPMPEFAGDGVVYFDPEDPSELADELRRVMSDESLQEKLKQLAKQRSDRYYWEDTSMRTWREIMALTKSE